MEDSDWKSSREKGLIALMMQYYGTDMSQDKFQGKLEGWFEQTKKEYKRRGLKINKE